MCNVPEAGYLQYSPNALYPNLGLCVNNLVDPASSHMLVSETKPCMSKYKP